MDFINDEEKMRDFYQLTKKEFLFSYSYLTEAEYDATVIKRLKILLWNAIDYMRDDFVSKSCIEINEMIADYLGSTVDELRKLEIGGI